VLAQFGAHAGASAQPFAGEFSHAAGRTGLFGAHAGQFLAQFGKFIRCRLGMSHADCTQHRDDGKRHFQILRYHCLIILQSKTRYQTLNHLI
jgi:hypothetical protein